jgi:hypothetical protein
VQGGVSDPLALFQLVMAQHLGEARR